MDLNLVTFSERLRRGEVSALEATEACLARIDKFDSSINAFRHVFGKEAREQAKRCDGSGPLDGIPIAVKDNIDVAGQVTRSGLGPRDERPAESDAEVVTRLRDAGAVILGHLSMHEGALGATTDNPHYGRTHNPWRLGFTPGGSSGGSGAAIAAGFCPLALGTDTLGSVRLPAAYCGVVGFKPSNGFLSNAGIEPLCAKLDQVGPLARSVADIRCLMEAVTGQVIAAMLEELADLRFGRLRCFDQVEWSDDVRRAWENCLYRMHQADIDVHDLAIENLEPDRLRRAGLLLAEAEAAEHFAADRARFPKAFSEGFAAMLDYGAGATPEKLEASKDYLDHVAGSFDGLFEEIDLLIAPTVPQTAFNFDDEAPVNQAYFTSLANVAGAPAISMPILSADLPVGLQLIGRRGADGLVLSVAQRLEDELNFKSQPLNLEEMI